MVGGLTAALALLFYFGVGWILRKQKNKEKMGLAEG